MPRSLLLAGLVLLAPFALAQPTPQDEAKRLEARANELTRAIGDLTQSANLASNDEAVAQLKRMVDELAEIRKALQRIAGTTPAAPARPAPNTRVSAYFQFQGIRTDREDGPNSAFRIRRFRLSARHDVDAQLGFRASVEAAGATNQITLQLRDAYALYTPQGRNAETRSEFMAGQFFFPLGTDLASSSGDRFWPERAQYNQVLFSGERGRGVQARYVQDGLTLFAGVMNALSITDPEQTNQAAGPDGKLVAVAGARVRSGGLEVGVSGLAGERPKFETSSSVELPNDARRILNGEIRYRTPDDRLRLQLEAMTGTDRVPGTTRFGGEAQKIGGLLAQANWRLGSANWLMLRHEQFDRSPFFGDTLTAFGLGYLHDIRSDLRLTVAQEWFKDSLRSDGQRYSQTTVRLQFRF